MEAREALYDIYQQWCRDQGLPSRAFGSVLYKSREMGRLFVIKGEEVRNEACMVRGVPHAL